MKKKLVKNKKVTVIGLGLHGGGVASVKWLVKHGAIVTVTDLKSKIELKSSLAKLKGLKVKYVLGKHLASNFSSAELIIQNPGVPKESKYLQVAKKARVLIENDASLFFKLCPASIIGITGTRGKSTTVALVYELLKKSKQTVWLAGLPQKPMLDIIDRVKPGDIVILELSSWQLEILAHHKLSPNMAVVTNIYPDHLDRYKSMSDYIGAKKSIFLGQNKDDTVILNLDNNETEKMGSQVVSQLYWFSKKYFSEKNGCFIKNSYIWFRHNGQMVKLAKLDDIRLSGEHNLENILAAITIVSIFKLSPVNIKQVVKKFSGLPGRIELVNEAKGIQYINDTTATMPDATIAALSQLPNKTVILIAGGSAKNIPLSKYKELASLIKQKCKSVILFVGQGSDKLEKELKLLKFKSLITEVPNMTEATILARTYSQSGDTVLLSPACASFGLFINEFDRGDQFNKAVRQFK